MFFNIFIRDIRDGKLSGNEAKQKSVALRQCEELDALGTCNELL
jgi:hypothetical protein